MILLAALTLFAKTPDVRDVIGTGNQPCVIAMSAGRKTEADTWTLGFWSGANAAGPRNIVIGNGAGDVLARVAAYCAAHTGVPLHDAVTTVLGGKD